MMKRIFLTGVATAMALITLPAAAPAQPGSHPFVFYGENGEGSSYLGVQTEDVTPERVGELHLKEERGVEITTVDQDAPAAKAGLKDHDVILSVNDQKIESVEQLKRVIREIPSGRTVSIGISRDGQPMTLKAQLEARDKIFVDMDHPMNFAMPTINIPAIHVPPINMPEMDIGPIVVIHSLARSGLMVENLTPQLSDYFGVKSGTGVLVRSVEKGSRGEQAGFKAGDVITKINGADVSDCSDFTRLLRKRTDNKAAITIMRERKEQTLTLALPEPKRNGKLNEKCSSEDLDDCVQDLKNDVSALAPGMDFAEVRKQMAQMQPEMKKLQKQIQREVLDHQEEFKKDMEQMRQQMEKQKEDLKQQMKEWVKDSEI
jgi:serine protease Do